MLPADWRRRYRGLLTSEHRLAPLTSWRIGGPAAVYLEPESVEELAATVDALHRLGRPYRVLGGGSNLLVADRGTRDAVLSLRRLRAVERTENGLRVEAGARLATVVRAAVEHGLEGSEPLAGIPGTVGGAVFGNAGGKYGDIGSLVSSLDLLRNGRVERIQPEPGFFQYRSSSVGSAIVLCAELRMGPASRDTVRRRAREIILERRAHQPGWVGNAGCVFANPTGRSGAAASAGALIDSAGLKGARVGGVEVSARHANFFENVADGTSEDVERLIDRVQEGVWRFHGVELQLEVRRWD